MRLAAVRGLLAGIILIGVIGWAVSGSAVYMRLAYLGSFFLAGNAFWAWLSIRGIRLRRKTRLLRASVGDIFEERFEVTNAARQPCLWLEVKNQSPLPMAGGSRLLTNIGPRQKRFYAIRNLLTERGAFPLGPTTLTTGDMFGLFTSQRVVPFEKTLVVLPMLFSLSNFIIPVGLLPGGKYIRMKTNDVTPHAAGLREYVPSDPLKRIHWPSTAKRARFMVKEFEQDPQADIWIFLDAQREIQAGKPRKSEAPLAEDGWWLQRRGRVSLPEDTFEYAVSISASLARHFLQQRRPVGLGCSTGKFTIIQAERGERQAGKILETLALVKPDGDLPFWGLISMQAKLLPIGSSVILVTPSVRSEVLSVADYLQRRSLRPVVVLINSRTFGGASGSEPLADGLLNRGIPICLINCGDDLSAKLTLPERFFGHSFVSGSSRRASMSG